MKIKRMIAAFVLAVILTGCQADTKPQSSNTSGAATTSSATQTTPETTTVSTTETTTATMPTKTTTLTTTQTTAEVPQVKLYKPVIYDVYIEDPNDEYTPVIIRHSLPENYTSDTIINLYKGTTPDEKDLIGVFPAGDRTIDFPSEGVKYYWVQFEHNGETSELSEPYYYYHVPVKPKVEVHEYTHTFMPSADGWTIVPDYTEAINELNNGIQPTKFQIKVYWTCPYCGNRKGPYSYNLQYSEDSWKIIGSTGCLMTSCPGHKDKTQCTVTSYAVQIS